MIRCAHDWICSGRRREIGYWVLRISPDDFENVRAVDAREFQAALDRAAERVRREGAGDGRR
jgi:hypothetical protein